jgi:hypothetical protein
LASKTLVNEEIKTSSVSQEKILDPSASIVSNAPPVVKNTPGLSSADRIRAAMLKEAEEKKLINVELSKEAVEKVWKDYADNHNSKSSQTALSNIKIELDNYNIKVSTPTLYVKEVVMQEVKLMEEIRAYFHREDLILIVDVDKEKFPDYEDGSVVKVRLSTKEIYQSMLQKNPVLEDFIKTLELKSSNSD